MYFTLCTVEKKNTKQGPFPSYIDETTPKQKCTTLPLVTALDRNTPYLSDTSPPNFIL